MGAALLLATAPLARGQQPDHPARADTLVYVLRFADREIGTQRTWRSADGTRWSRYEASDHGRESVLLSRVRAAAGGVPVDVEITGHDQLGNPVTERFRRDGRAAWWRSAAERGTDSTPGADSWIYVPVAATPEDRAMLARALLAAPGHEASLLPAGHARVEQVLARALPRPDGGGNERAKLVAIHGLGIVPRYLWLGEHDALLAELGAATSLVRREWTVATGALAAVQDSVAAARGRRLAETLAHRAAGTVVLRNGTVIDVARGRARPRHSVVVRAGRILEVGPDARVRAAHGSHVIDLGGRTVLPGLWDMHAHVQDDEGPLFLAAGVTTVRDMGNRLEPLAERSRRFGAGTLLGPRIVIAGLIDGPGAYTAPGAVVVTTTDEARAAVVRYAGAGARQIKIYGSLAPVLVPAIVEAARQLGMSVIGHVPAGMTAGLAVTQGFAELQHANFLFLDFLRDSIGDTRTTARVRVVAERGATVDLDGPVVRSVLDTLRARGVALDPTLNVFEHLLLARSGSPSPPFASVSARLPLLVQRGFKMGGAPVPDGMDARYRASYAAMLRLVGQAHRAGVPVLVGSDAFAGFALLRELELHVAAGIPPLEVLRMATLGAARQMRMERELGTIAPGKLADLLVVDGDPTRTISDVRRAHLVMKEGTIYRPAAIYRALGVAP